MDVASSLKLLWLVEIRDEHLIVARWGSPAHAELFHEVLWLNGLEQNWWTWRTLASLSGLKMKNLDYVELINSFFTLREGDAVYRALQVQILT